MTDRLTVELTPTGDQPDYYTKYYALEDAGKTLRDLLREAPATSLEPLAEDVLDRPLRLIRLELVGAESAPTPQSKRDGSAAETTAMPPEPNTATRLAMPIEVLDEADAVRLAHGEDMRKLASFLAANLSVLVFCDKLIVKHLWKPIVVAAGREWLELKPPEDEPAAAGPFGAMQAPGFRQKQMTELRKLIKAMHTNQVLVLQHLDLLSGGGERGMNPDARELTELLYEFPDRLLLAFADRTLAPADVITHRFAIRAEISGLPRDIEVPGKGSGQAGKPTERMLVCDALVTRSEAGLFNGFDARELFKNVAGMNPVRMRNAITYAVHEVTSKDPSSTQRVSVSVLHDAIRSFKAQTSEQFEIPRVTMDDIGGYEDVKFELGRALALMAGAGELPDERLRRELIPRGFLLWGPPGTGKTLFAKAVANQLNATIRIVSGPEVTNKYVGESERNVRLLFAEARRNAPSVLVFDEFDAIAASRTGRDDGGSRAGNALVAQILTEMDGFRPDVPMLVVATTNQLKLIDEALLRPSRFQPIHVGLPDRNARRHIAKIHADHFKVDVSDQILDLIADTTDRMNGDQIRSIFRDACVGMHCENPPKPPSVERIGTLVGKLSSAMSAQRLQRQQDPGADNREQRSDVRIRPRGQMSRLGDALPSQQSRPQGSPNIGEMPIPGAGSSQSHASQE